MPNPVAAQNLRQRGRHDLRCSWSSGLRNHGELDKVKSDAQSAGSINDMDRIGWTWCSTRTQMEDGISVDSAGHGMSVVFMAPDVN